MDGHGTAVQQKAGGRFAGLHLMDVERRITAGEYVDGRELGDALRKLGSRPIPAPVLDYLCCTLDGEVSKPSRRKGRPPSANFPLNVLRRGIYRRNLAWLTARKARYGHLKGWSYLHDADFWQGPPHEIAARMTARRLSYGARSWRRISNIASSRK